MEKKFIKTDLAPSAVGTYSQGVEWNGMILFSGQIGIDPQTSTLVEGFDAQLDQIMKNIDGLLKSQDLTREHILKTSIFMTDLGLFSKVNEVYENYFSAPFPARSCIQVPALPKGALIEIEVIAARKIS
ncbi:MAG: reactive intermediate/imine deaminase [Halobacteriovorax sp.]|nr:reactive intermediate/imine deaminase [Halobacteriovorax sp.]MEE3080001.1 Rid family detoxifying hydrolase [Bdellovibrionota bacterium]|tara:strand:- start:2414 stop:2800 length:387 start_codon:yes stop_codon:yes gene_type:complete